MVETHDRPLILAVEDDPTGSSIIALLCNRYGCDVERVDTCEGAVAAVISLKKFSLILMDVRLPDHDGLECTKLIRRLEKETGVKIPIVAVTADAMPGDRQRCLNAGMDDYLSKPFTMQDFKRLLDKWVLHDEFGKIVKRPLTDHQ